MAKPKKTTESGVLREKRLETLRKFLLESNDPKYGSGGRQYSRDEMHERDRVTITPEQIK